MSVYQMWVCSVSINSKRIVVMKFESEMNELLLCGVLKVAELKYEMKRL
ncbi:MAG: hypothetical protein O3C41_07895 [Bacteroidetes bacterium]|nr:hypothetical protein [Bacteroidota bacterium]